MNISRVLVVVLILAVIQACSTSEPLIPDMDPDWQSDIPVESMGTAFFMEESERIVVGNDNDIYILDLNTGQVIEQFDQHFWQRILPDTTVTVMGEDEEKYQYNPDDGTVTHKETGEEVSDYSETLGDEFAENIQESVLPFEGVIADAYTLIPHESSNRMMLFDYRFFNESITALDIDTGDPTWQTWDHQFSMGKYSDLMALAHNTLAHAGAQAFGGEAQTLTDRDMRRNQVSFMNTIFYEVPDSDYFIFKTFDGLVLYDAAEGEQIWHVEEFDGAGLAGVEYLPNGDFVVLSSDSDFIGGSVLDVDIADEYHLARISAEGEVRWMVEHNASHTEDLFVSDDHVIVDASPTEVFDIENGDKLWESDAEYRMHRPYNILVTDNRMFVAGDLEHQYVTVGHRGWIWEFDLDTGEVLWKTEETRTVFEQPILVDDVLIVSGDGTYFGGNGGVVGIDVNSGEELWKTPEMAAFGWHGFVQEGVYYGHKVTKPFIYEDIVYAAGPDNIYAMDLNTGELIFEDEHDAHGTGGNNGELVMYGDKIILVGLDAIVAYNKYDGTLEYATETESTSSFTAHENHIVIRNGNERAGAFNPETGELGPMMRTEYASGGRFGDLSNGIYVSHDGNYVYVLEGGNINRYSLY